MRLQAREKSSREIAHGKKRNREERRYAAEKDRDSRDSSIPRSTKSSVGKKSRRDCSFTLLAAGSEEQQPELHRRRPDLCVRKKNSGDGSFPLPDREPRRQEKNRDQHRNGAGRIAHGKIARAENLTERTVTLRMLGLLRSKYSTMPHLSMKYVFIVLPA
ncbi:hypothetical protein KSP39_PZI000748 [Platanthera zijinensis]|uniref:Uncharacterized protein n=1 Tax=Platanthera zijinensis TaxID=2320716 RepID=A0AAP0C4P6_9ASPA